MEAQLTAILLGVVLVLVGYLYVKLVLLPNNLRLKLQSQGISGPPPSSIFLGNIPQIIQFKSRTTTPVDAKLHHDWPFILFPHLVKWQSLYGPVFTYSTGRMQILCVTDPNVVKDIILSSSVDLGKPSYLSKERGPLLGQGIISSSGSLWSYQRKIISPEFFPEKVKGMFGLMVEATTSMLSSWEDRVSVSGGIEEITIDEDLRSLSADVISKAAFGSSYSQGKDIFSKLREIQRLMSQTLHVGIPFARYMPTRNNREMKRLDKEVNSMILSVVRERMGVEHEMDFLQKILDGARKCSEQDGDVTLKMDVERLIIDNCKNIYFAGYETTATAASWSLMLMAAFPYWQTRARAEVLEACGNGILTVESLRNMKVV